MIVARILGAWLVVLGAFIVLSAWDSGLDDCLDAGGRWNEVARVCEGAR